MIEPLRLAVLAALVAGVGTTLVLSDLRWFKRVSLTERLSPFSGTRSSRTTSLETFHEALVPLVSSVAERIARTLGVKDELALRLKRADWQIDSSTFRLRQFGYSAGALGIGLVVVAAVQPPLMFALLMIAGLPALAFLLLEQQLITAVQSRRQRLLAELPVFSEQLAMLLAAGYSLGAALNRLSERQSGVSGKAISEVCDRTRHGLSISAALREWDDDADLLELHRLISILCLNSETSDLGRLVSDEAKTIRAGSQRRLIETIEKRGQQVWVPVTVATLIPGVIFLVIPFLQALQLFSGS